MGATPMEWTWFPGFLFLSGSINKGGGHEIRVGASFPFVRLSYFHESLTVVCLTPLNFLAEGILTI